MCLVFSAEKRRELPSMVLVSMPDPDNKGGGVLTLISNQDGFTEGDVKSICKLARTTKQELKNQPLQTKRARKKQIGHKGLGFKSVFTIAHTVYIYSNDFRFSLSSKPEPGIDSELASVIPTLLPRDKLPRAVGESLKLAFPGQGEDAEGLDSLLQRHTVFTLSLHPDFDFHARCQPLLTPSLLLFLDEIRRIEYVDWQREARMVLSKVRSSLQLTFLLCSVLFTLVQQQPHHPLLILL